MKNRRISTLMMSLVALSAANSSETTSPEQDQRFSTNADGHLVFDVNADDLATAADELAGEINRRIEAGEIVERIYVNFHRDYPVPEILKKPAKSRNYFQGFADKMNANSKFSGRKIA